MKEVWGSCDAWAAEFRTLVTLRGIGWVLLVRDGEGSLRNIWVNEHDIGHLVGATPILVMDVFEHAFMLDYGLKRSDYIAAFWKAVDWPTVQRRYDDVQ
jgi:Fe-Mn family superoxide dismutase